MEPLKTGFITAGSARYRKKYNNNHGCHRNKDDKYRRKCGKKASDMRNVTAVKLAFYRLTEIIIMIKILI